jgi:hypothetical protein
VKSKFDKPRLFGEVITILISMLDFSVQVFNDEEDNWTEFTFEFDDDEGTHYFFEQDDLEELVTLLFDTGMDTDGQGISIEDQENYYPSGANWQLSFYGFTELELLTSRDNILLYKSQSEKLKAKTPFDARVKEFLVQCLDVIYETSECNHEFSDKDDMSINCKLCGLLVWDPATLAELTGSWH